MIRALYQAGAPTPDGLAVIAEAWRPVEVYPEMDHGALVELNCQTLEILDARDVLAPAPPEIYAIIQNNWIFLLRSLDLQICKVKKEMLREERGHWSPDGS